MVPSQRSNIRNFERKVKRLLFGPVDVFQQLISDSDCVKRNCSKYAFGGYVTDKMKFRDTHWITLEIDTKVFVRWESFIEGRQLDLVTWKYQFLRIFLNCSRQPSFFNVLQFVCKLSSILCYCKFRVQLYIAETYITRVQSYAFCRNIYCKTIIQTILTAFDI